ncbi:Sugar phosphate isomerase/epimerase [Enhydrobacter aerosaccus]|uniref:Sugar phosphate isomerase/epimerase n=1 Tax=Enhydrobacter aerosaccus TaxID=225324 RepID=A0A1T4SGG0_9HYPH|nr:sugar phosphate isomerase/epimerase [Enhydrobacter aerosaccus]SKA27420.1 Sugar phosphate isomerase/epimerase [Enhydrobacter aerosaccus]
MALPRLALTVIGDEIGSSLSDMISFCAEHQVRRLDMRTVGGRNLLGMSLAEIADISDALEDAGITVPTLVSPLLKWTAPDKSRPEGAVDFAFDPSECPRDDPLAYAFDIATVLNASRVRIFSYLRYPDFQPKDLDRVLYRLLDIAGGHDALLELENEPICNVGNIAELAHFFTALPELIGTQPEDMKIQPLVDIGNSYAMGAPPEAADIARLAPLVDMIHLKDRDLAGNRTVPLGDGDIPWAAELQRLLSAVEVPEVIASIETHCPQDGRNATARSVAALRRIAEEIGAEIV